jgi:iron-sulfur cluster assembly protein
MAIIDVTDTAAGRIRDLLERDDKLATHGLRLKVIGGGCSGLRYELTFDDQVRDVDTEIECRDIRVIVDEKSALYLMGTTLDFVDTLNESGFKVINPNASQTCGCGESFAA